MTKFIYSGLSQRFSEKIACAKEEIFWVAPFITSPALKHFLSAAKNNMQLTIVTRWGMRDVMSGISDPEVFPLVKAYGGKIFHNTTLHAKYYRTDGSLLVGSANITSMGFSISGPGNLETLVEIDGISLEMRAFESILLEQSREIDDDFYMLMMKYAALAPHFMEKKSHLNEDATILLERWWPTSQEPEELWNSYLGKGSLNAHEDLSPFYLPPGLDEDLFRNSIFIQMSDIPNIKQLMEFVQENGRRFGEMRELVRRIDPTVKDATSTWQSLFKWLLYFGSEKYEYFRPNYTEIIRQKRI